MSEQAPHITVATVVERDGRILMVKERAEDLLVYNQPAGHLQAGENLVEAAERETREETAWLVSVSALLGIYQYTSALNGISYVRICFIAQAVAPLPDAILDPDIAEALWLTPAEIEKNSGAMRSPLVLAAIHDYQAGQIFPLSMLSNY